MQQQLDSEGNPEQKATPCTSNVNCFLSAYPAFHGSVVANRCIATPGFTLPGTRYSGQKSNKNVKRFLTAVFQFIQWLQELVISAVLGVMLGWPVAGVAFLPLALLVLLSPRLARSFVLLIVLCAALLAAVAASDQYFYGRPTVRLQPCGSFGSYVDHM